MMNSMLRALRELLGFKPGERLLIVAAPEMSGCAVAMAQSLSELGAPQSLLQVTERDLGPAGVGPLVRAALEQTDVALIMSRHWPAAAATVLSCRVRAAFVPDIHLSELLRVLDVDYASMRAYARELSDALAAKRRLRIRSALGTDLSAELDESGLRLDLNAGSAIVELPPGRLVQTPVLSGVEGILVVDSCASEVGKLEEPIRLRISGGMIQEYSGPEALGRLDRRLLRVSAIGFGANPRAVRNGNPAVESRAIGGISVGLGSNVLYGGTLDAPLHVTLCLAEATVEVDTHPLSQKFVTPIAAPTVPAPFIPLPEVYRLFFDHSNDPQYILDLETMVFVKVNRAFENLTGYAAAECERKLSAVDLAATESKDHVVRTRERRRVLPSERYEIKIRCKDGSVKPVEISVQRVALGGREVVIGSIRDLSEQKKLTDAMWERVEELIRSNSRIGIIKEKLEQMQNLAQELFNVRDERAVFELAAQYMRDRSRLAYEDVTFYVLQGQALHVAYATSPAQKTPISVESDQPVAAVFRGAAVPYGEAGRLVLPLKGMETNLGVMEVRIPPKEWDTLNGSPAAVRSYQNIARALSNLIGLAVENIRLYERIFQQTIMDPLTQCHNRRYLDSKLEEEIKRSARYKRPLSLLMLDVNGFKQINDTMGHREGDVVLQEIGALLKRSTREVDIVARYGGDEFMIVLPETARENALVKATLLTQVLEAHGFTNLFDPSQKLKIAVSIGVASFDDREEIKEAEDLIRHADESMYRIKSEQAKARGTGS